MCRKPIRIFRHTSPFSMLQNIIISPSQIALWHNNYLSADFAFLNKRDFRKNQVLFHVKKQAFYTCPGPFLTFPESNFN